LSAFREEDKDLFFGREKFVQQLVDAVKQHSLVPVIGASGSGKSSVVLAGLIPRLQEEETWLIASFRPQNEPFYGLASALIRVRYPKLQKEEQDKKTLDLSNWMNNDVKLWQIVINILEENHGKQLLLVIDQFEELYALDSEKQQQFVDALLDAIKENPIRLKVVLTIRTDFLDRIMMYPRFKEAALQQKSHKFLGAMNREEMRSVIELVDRHKKKIVKLEEGLTDRILADVQQEPGNLPLLEFALTQLWKENRGGTLTLQTYEKIGGVKKALANHADKIYDRLNEEEKQQAQQIFLQLARPGEMLEDITVAVDTRRLATRAEIGESNWNLVQKLASSDRDKPDKERQLPLLVTGRNDGKEEQTVEVVHEALIREWGQLQKWIDDDRAFLTWRHQLRAQKKQWESPSKDEGALLRGRPLVIAEDWLQKRPAELINEEEYINQSLALRKRDRDNRFRNQRRLIYCLVGGLISLSFAFGWALWQKQVAEIERQGATALQNFESGAGEIEALQSAMQAGQDLKTLDAKLDNKCWPDCPATSPLLALQTIVDNIHQKNQIDTYQKGINSLRFIKNDQQIVTSGDDGTVKWWDLKGKRLKNLKLHNQSIISIDFSTNEDKLVIGTSDGWVKLFDISGKEPKPINDRSMQHVCGKGQKKCSVNNVRFLPKSNLLATTGDDGKLRLWSLNGKNVKIIDAHKGSIKSLNYSPDDEKLATAGKDGIAKVWNLDGKLLQSFEGHKSSVNSIWFKADKKQVATASDDGDIKMWDVSNGKLLKSFPAHLEGVESVRISSDEQQQIATAGKDGTVRLWDFEGKRLAELKGHKGSVISIRFNKDGNTLATSGKDDGTVRLWDVSKQEKHVLRPSKKIVNSVRFNPKNSQQIATASDDGMVKLWEVKDNKWVETKSYKTDRGNVTSVRFSPDGQQLATAGSNGMVTRWDLTSTKLKEFNTNQGNVESVNFSPDGQQLATAGSDGTVKLWNLNGDLLNRFLLEERVESVRFSPDGKLLAIVGSDGVARLWSINSGSSVKLDSHQGSVYSASFNKNGTQLATAGDDGILRLWDFEGKKLAEFKTFQGRVRNISFSPDGKLLATVAANYTVRLWNISGKKLVAEYKGHEGGVRSVDFSPNGKQLVTASEDGTARVWSIRGLDDLLKESCDWLKIYRDTNPEAQKKLHMCPKR